MDNANLWTRRANSAKLSLSMNGPDGKDGGGGGARVELPRTSKRFGPDSSHGRSNPFNAISPLSGGVASPSTNASSAFGLGSGAFASFGAPKTPGVSSDTGSVKTPGVEQSILGSVEGQKVRSPGAGAAKEHPLKSTWVIWYRPPTPKYSDYEKSTIPLASISSVESFWSVYSHLKRPSLLPTVSDYHIFKRGIRPVWEDEANKKGGKWIVRFKKGVADRYWEDLLLAIVGDQFAEAADEVCGAVLSVRSGEDVLSVWTRIDGGRNIKIRETIKRLLVFPADTNIVWKSHDDSIAQRSAIDQARQEKAQHHQHHQHHHNNHQHHPGADRRRTTTNDDPTGDKGKRKLTISKVSHDLPRNRYNDMMGSQKSERDKVDRNDMERLLPDYSSGRKEKQDGAVPIVPGQTISASTTKKSKPAQQFSVKPVDNLSRKARQSGPVRAGKQRARAVQETYSGLDLVPSETEKSNDSERSERSPKRRRCNPQESKIIHVSDGDDVMEQSAPLQDTLSGKKQNQQIASGVQIQVPRSPEEENRNTQGHISSDDNDELFTEQATKERRLKRPRQNSKHEIIQGVEIQPPKVIRPKDLNSSPSLQRQSKNTDKMRHSSDARESPDEIQGEVTVPPAPPFLVHRKKDIDSKPDIEAAERGASRPQSSPSNITQTNFSPGKRPGKRNRNKRKKGKGHCSFKASYVRLGTNCLISSDKNPIEVHVDTVNGGLEAVAGSVDSSPPIKVQPQRILQVIRGEYSCCKLRLKLTSQAESPFPQMDIELLSTEEQDGLCNSIQGPKISFQTKPSCWMDEAFKNTERDVSRYANNPKRPSCEGLPEQESESNAEPAKRQKLANSLQMGHESTIRPLNDVHINSNNPSASANGSNEISNRDEVSDHGLRGHPPRLEVSTSVEIPAKASVQGRQTRSTTRPVPAPTVVCDDDDGDDNVALPTSGAKSQKWESPLVYPHFGKKKAEVDSQDRERLRDNEFLNDNLIGFYIRFLEDHLDRTNNEAAKRVYFFNSYFYAALTNTPRNKKPINYESVQKWTRSVDIFSHDYIVVPINEAAHWYVAIICNLPNMQEFSKEEPKPEKPPADGGKKVPAQTEADVQAIPETPVPSEELPGQDESGEQKSNNETAKEETARQSMAEMTLHDSPDRNNETAKVIPAASDEDWPEKEETPKVSPVRFSSPPTTRASQQKGSKETAKVKPLPRRPKKQKKATQMPRDPHQPTIITLDSLDQARSPTIRNLRLYLTEEAKSKKGIDIDTTLIAAQRARSIPLQSNFSDCGLYLLAYVEKFVQNPDLFASKLLRQEMNANADWPYLTSGQLRLRLRTFLDDLYDEQEQLSREKASEGFMMADQQPISFLLGDDSGSEKPTGESSNPTTDTAQVKSSPQPEKTPEPVSQPLAADTEPEEKPLEEATEPKVPDPSQTPSIPQSQASDTARSPKQKSGRMPKAVRKWIHYLERPSQQSGQGAFGEAVVVPDSQEESIDALGLVSPKKLDGEMKVETPVEKLENQDSRQPVTIDDGNDDVAEVYPPETSQVKVQVKQTPPPENTKQ